MPRWNLTRKEHINENQKNKKPHTSRVRHCFTKKEFNKSDNIYAHGNIYIYIYIQKLKLRLRSSGKIVWWYDLSANLVPISTETIPWQISTDLNTQNQ